MAKWDWSLMKRTNQTLKRIVGVGVIALLFYVISSNLFTLHMRRISWQK